MVLYLTRLCAITISIPRYMALLDFPHGWWADLDFNF